MFLVGFDMLFCLFYIIDYNNYAGWDFYLLIGIVLIADCFSRYFLLPTKLSWLPTVCSIDRVFMVDFRNDILDYFYEFVFCCKN